ncbi:MAG TPA: PfkB family carbohydrate kinase [Acidimicrobiales bacterium]|jgi:sugar/nucleoside kinase (ribokinase family)|nr:PfkB family carbohydrate kinase [Acidimicrobiales bacterium]
MSDAPRLFCLDTVLIDVVLKVSTLPQRAGDALASEKLVTTGGGFNAMSAAARHHMAVVYAGRLGEGPFSELAATTLDHEHIAAPVTRNEDLDTGICVVLLEPDGERSFVTSPGAEATLRAADLDALGVGADDYVLVSGYNVMYPELGATVLAWIASLPLATKVVFDPATRMVDIPKPNLEAMVERANWLLCNIAEASTLTGRDDAAEAATSLASRNDTLDVLVRSGAHGCAVALNHQDAVVVPGFSTTVVDTNGAGDVHNGVFVAELASGHDPLDAARWANAAAAMAISKLGPATGPRRDEVEAWITQSTE